MTYKNGVVLELHELVPTRLVGVMMWLVDSGQGVLVISLNKNPDLMLLSATDGGGVRGSIKRSVTMHLIANLRFLAAELRWMRGAGESAVPAERLDASPIDFVVHREGVSFEFVGPGPWSNVAEDEESIEWRIPAAFAARFEDALSNALGRFVVINQA